MPASKRDSWIPPFISLSIVSKDFVFAGPLESGCIGYLAPTSLVLIFKACFPKARFVGEAAVGEPGILPSLGSLS